MPTSNVDEMVEIKGKVYTKDEVLEKCDTYYNDLTSHWHVPVYTANTDYRFYQYGLEVQGPFYDSYEFLDKYNDAEHFQHLLDIKPGDKIDVYATAKDEWQMYNKNNDEAITLTPLTTRIGADDGHHRFILGFAAAFSYIPNVKFSIPFRFENKEEAVQFIIKRCIYYKKL